MGVDSSLPRLVFVVNVDWYFLMHWLERAVAAKRAGFSVTVISNSSSLSRDMRFSDAEIDWVYWPVSRFSMGVVQLRSEYISLKRILDRLEPTIVHSITIKPNLLCGIYARLNKSNCRYVQTFPGMGAVLGGTSVIDRLKKSIATGLLRWTCRGGDAFSFENTDDESYFKNCVLSQAAGVLVSLGAGVDLERYAFRKNFLSAGEPLRILHAARLLRSKGLPALAEAVVLLRKDGHSIELCVAGIEELEAPDAISIDWLKENHDRGIINFIGQCADMPALISKFHMVALPTSYGEGIPRVLIEAAAMGRCIVTTDVAGCRELVIDGETGLLVRDADPKSIAAVILRVLNNRDLVRQLGLSARKHVESGYDKHTVIQQFLSLYQGVLAERVL